MVGERIKMYDDESGSNTALLQHTLDIQTKKKKKISEKNSLKLINVGLSLMTVLVAHLISSLGRTTVLFSPQNE